MQKLEELFDGTLGNWSTDPVDFEFQEDKKPILYRKYPVPKVHEEIFKKEIERFVLL